MSRWGDTIDAKLKRAGALALTFWTVIFVPTGLALAFYGISTRIRTSEWQEPLSVGVGLVAVGAITWYLSRRLHEGPVSFAVESMKTAFFASPEIGEAA